jgi:cardiolipin synthase
MIIPFVWYLSHHAYKPALYVYILAGMTDGLDGWLARRFNWQTPMGQFLDPLADKLLVATSFIALGVLNILPWWLVVLVFLRDLTISVGAFLWAYLIDRKSNFPPSFISKWNTCFQLVLVTACLFEQAFFPLRGYFLEGLILLTAATTLTSFVDYAWTWGKKAYLVRSSKTV